MEVHKDGVGGVDGLLFATAVTVSPDGDHVYATGGGEQALAVFSRNSTTGALTFVEVHKNGVGGVFGLDFGSSVTLSPDGVHLYTAGRNDNAVAVFSRNSTTGALTFVEVHKDGVGGVDGLLFATAVTVSPDGDHVYATGGGEQALAVFSRNSTTGALTFVEVHKNGVGGVFGRDFGSSVTLSPDGVHLYTAGRNDNAVAVFSRNSTTGALTFVEVHKDGVGGVDGLLFATAVTVSPDGDHVYATGGGEQALAVFSRNSTTGALTFVEVHKNGVGGVFGLDFGSSVTLSPDGVHLYTAGRNDNAVAVFSRNSTTGVLTFVEVQLDGVGGVDGLDDIRSVAVSPDGKHLYAAGSVDSAVGVFSRDSTTGALIFVEVIKDDVGVVDGLNGAISVSVSPDGKHVYAAGINDNALAVFSRNSTTGTLTFVEFLQDGVGGVDGLADIRWVTVSPDGKHVYTAASSDNALAVFSRSTTTGALTFVTTSKDGVGGVDGLLAARSVTVSSDGKHVYSASGGDNAVAGFSRNPTTGVLTFVTTSKDGVGGVDGLGGALVATVSPDGKHVYVTGNTDDAVAAFSRNSTTGALTFVDFYKDGVGGVDGLNGAFPVSVSPDGDHVYVGGDTDDAVAVFSRNSTTGALTFVTTSKDGVGGVDGLDGTVSLTVSPDGRHIYAGGSAEDAIAVLSGHHADLSITKSADRSQVAAGFNLTYTLTATNDGPGSATGVTVTDTLPGTVTFVSASAGCGESGGIVTCTTGSLASGASVQFTITVTAPGALGPITNTVNPKSTEGMTMQQRNGR